MTDAWSPNQYHRFRDQRSAPFHDLLALVRAAPGGRAVDLGCGSGELTVLMAEQTGCAEVLGIDSSPAMLAEAATHERRGLRFAKGDLATWGDSSHPVDLVMANAALHWVPDH
ncbi:MAG: methyltransferase domain-containing protein, partial [Actinomycetota bacterium]|nr:methyltransferase domain-containing protein [Actinomycetota bacterium]